eukprot:2746251-Pyramimonas_sp.AAC.1
MRDGTLLPATLGNPARTSGRYPRRAPTPVVPPEVGPLVEPRLGVLVGLVLAQARCVEHLEELVSAALDRGHHSLARVGLVVRRELLHTT